VCSQGAKILLRTTNEVESILTLNDTRVAALVAPSFTAEFPDIPFDKLVGMIRQLGFYMVNEVAFGADLVAREYRNILNNQKDNRYIATTCPAVVSFIEKYNPSLVPYLAPVVSPMIATARAVKRLAGEDLKMVFIGPCIAKKVESAAEALEGEIDATITFLELREMFASHGITPDDVEPSDFDPPNGRIGMIFPVAGGMLQTAQIGESIVSGDAVKAEGRTMFQEAIKEFENGQLDARLLEVLCCDGCIMGAGMTTKEPMFKRRSYVSKYVKERLSTLSLRKWEIHMDYFKDLDLSRSFATNDQRVGFLTPEVDLAPILERLGKKDESDFLNCGACGYDTCMDHAIAIYRGLAEDEMCLPFTIEKLRKINWELETTNTRLADTQQQLMQSERLASMAQMATGIAHEVNNPLSVVLMYSHLLMDNCESDTQMKEDLGMIAEQADRCKKIVAGLLNFARQNKVAFSQVDIRDVVEKSLQTVPAPPNIKVTTIHKMENNSCELDKDQIVQVFTNLISNAYAAMPEGGKLTITTDGNDFQVHVLVSDSGIGIPQENIKKLYQPFFTTKQIGKGTGLGLAVTYGIIKMHKGDIKVDSNSNPAVGPTGTTFTVTVPRVGRKE
jgi:signal transduction histidine kinase